MFFQLDYDILYLPVRKCTKNQWNADEKSPQKSLIYESRPPLTEPERNAL